MFISHLACCPGLMSRLLLTPHPIPCPRDSSKPWNLFPFLLLVLEAHLLKRLNLGIPFSVTLGTSVNKTELLPLLFSLIHLRILTATQLPTDASFLSFLPWRSLFLPILHPWDAPERPTESIFIIVLQRDQQFEICQCFRKNQPTFWNTAKKVWVACLSISHRGRGRSRID